MPTAPLPAFSVASAPDTSGGIGGWIVSVMDALGAPGAGLLVFLENLFPPIPSELILPLAGYTASVGTLGIVAVLLWTTVGSVTGAWVLYGIGAWLGRDRLIRVVRKIPLVDVDEVEQAEDWFRRHGGASVFVGRLVPGVRSLISIPAGLERMSLVSFTLYTLAGSALWNSVLVGAGYLLGENWGTVGVYVERFQYVVIAVVLALVVWYIVHLVRKARAGDDAPSSPSEDDGTRRRGR